MIRVTDRNVGDKTIAKADRSVLGDVRRGREDLSRVPIVSETHYGDAAGTADPRDP